ncbi:MAG: outer membrane assembly protein BamE [Gammaproteobacteria bacterium CG11_big_fil_rev_8_21_14_0_20_46_22]|nr:MAG: outer membrane assembly protein BamE [Gammaproteobacteria bacterium CG12_big_fil_rev_8_21_14_0_65_46_12]PIR11069.1 MAG: outer membrane assembly protein BamE [Gammaproteobacteria bacterium CG11_big_fil_rev_8_21_14_0_20_46_22]
MKKLAGLMLMTLSLAGCGIIHEYRPDVQQGNVINWQHVAKLKLGMSKAQATDIMGGKPVLVNTFNDNELIYVYTLWPNRGPSQRSAVILTFKNNRLIKIDKQPEQTTS